MLGYRKKEFLHKQWDKNVYSTIRKEIDREVTGDCYDDLSKRKRGLHKEYLEHTNKKVYCIYIFILHLQNFVNAYSLSVNL